MSERTARERPETIRGYRYIRLKSGRLVSFWDMVEVIERAQTDLGRALSRAIKLASDDWDLERVESRLDALDEHLGAVRAYLDEMRGNVTKRERIALLRNTTGRTPEEAEAFRQKADELERDLAG